jgi:ABC-type antimicrobial peptide transport system permease subunit
LGARGSTVARPLLFEALMLAGTGGLLGVLAAPWLMRTVSAATLTGLPDYIQPGVSLTTVAFALILSLVTAVVSSVAPAALGSRVAVSAALRGGERGASLARNGRGPSATTTANGNAFKRSGTNRD